MSVQHVILNNNGDALYKDYLVFNIFSLRRIDLNLQKEIVVIVVVYDNNVDGFGLEQYYYNVKYY